jgi:hypothetical protein
MTRLIAQTAIIMHAIAIAAPKTTSPAVAAVVTPIKTSVVLVIRTTIGEFAGCISANVVRALTGASSQRSVR